MAKKTTQMTNTEARRMIEDDTKAFLKAGKKIQMIPSGVSGQDSMTGRKQLVMIPKAKPA